MASIGTLNQDRYEIELTDRSTMILAGLPLSERSRFLMWFARFKVLWTSSKSLHPLGTFQAFYDAEYIDDEGKLTPNPLYNSGLAWVIDHLLSLRGIPLDRIDADTAYALLVNYRGEPSVFDQLLVNYPRDPDGKPLAPNQDAAIDFMGKMLATGASAEDIKWCLDHVPSRELQQALMVAAESVEENKASDNKPLSKRESKSDRNERLTRCAEAFAKEFETQIFKAPDVEARMCGGSV
jgi:hypothetical protein